jgi:predicted transport protein
MKFADVKDPKGICKDITRVGRWGNGDCELFLDKLDQLDDVMDIIQQSHDLQIS